MKLPLLLHDYKYAIEIDPPTLAPVEVDGPQLERYIEWLYVYHLNAGESITEEQFVKMPANGLDKPDGFYTFNFDGGRFYIEIQNKALCQMSGYSTSELSLFDAIKREYGEALQKELQEAQAADQTVQRPADTEGVIGDKVAEVSQRAAEVSGENEPDTTVDIQPDQTASTSG
jgi:hypothetical protein